MVFYFLGDKFKGRVFFLYFFVLDYRIFFYFVMIGFYLVSSFISLLNLLYLDVFVLLVVEESGIDLLWFD